MSNQWVLEEILSELQCPVCQEYMRAPILHCENGHIVCDRCIKKLELCPICRGKQGPLKSRCFSMERIATKILYPCKFSLEGCDVLVPFNETIDHHLDGCKFQILKCPLYGTGLDCKWKGLASPLRNHIIEKHLMLASRYEASREYVAMIPVAGSWYHVMVFGEEIFFRFTQVTEDHFRSCILFVGPRKRASAFKYRMTIKTRKGDGMASVTCVAGHYLDDIKQLSSRGDCCSFDMHFVKRCANENRILPVDIRLMDNVPGIF